MTDEQLFEFILYLVSCSRLTLDELPVYGSFRLIEGASRLIEATGTGDAFLRESREAIERQKLLMIDDRAGYEAWLTELLREFATEATRRNMGEG
jgi:hypothetical protein